MTTFDAMTAIELRDLFQTVFLPRPTDHVLTVLVDIPDARTPDNDHWRERRALAYDWWIKAISFKHDLGLERVELFCYRNVGSNNNDLPPTLFRWGGSPEHLDADTLERDGIAVPLTEVMDATDLIIALTEFSATAPCKMLAKTHNFRGTTMPGFVAAMLPSLALDYGRVHERIMAIKTRLDAAVREVITLTTRGESYVLDCDLRNRTATASSGMFHDDMIVGNLPSGEAYIVPWEGEDSTTAGLMPVQFGEEIVVYRIEGNKAVEVLSVGPASDVERAKLADEPAYGNIAELGHGVLGEFGCTAVGNLLMDEKLGLHIAFGRSEHFGGSVSPAAWRDPKKVIHIDRVYVPSLQPDITVTEVVLHYPDGRTELLMRDGAWVFA